MRIFLSQGNSGLYVSSFFPHRGTCRSRVNLNEVVIATESDVEPILSVEEMAKLLGASRRTVLRRVKDGTIIPKGAGYPLD